MDRIQVLESKSEELAIRKLNKIQADKDLGESRGMYDPMIRCFEGIRDLGKGEIKRSVSSTDLYISLDAHIE